MGLIATMAALVLGLLIASAKSSYDTRRSELTEISGQDCPPRPPPGPLRTGDEGQPAICSAARLSACSIRCGPRDRARPTQLEPIAAGAEPLYDKIQGLAPQNDTQRSIQTQALSISIDIAQTRWLLFEQTGSSIPMPFLVVLVFWLTILFASFGLSAPSNATVITTLFVCALSVAGAIFLILELDRPFEGLVRVSSASLRNALAHLGQ